MKRLALALVFIVAAFVTAARAEMLTLSLTTGAGTLTQTRTLSAAHLSRLQDALSAAAIANGGSTLNAAQAFAALVDRWIVSAIILVRISEETTARAGIGSIGIAQ